MKKSIIVILALSFLVFWGCDSRKDGKNLTDISSSDVSVSSTKKEQSTAPSTTQKEREFESTENTTKHIKSETDSPKTTKTQSSSNSEESPPSDIVSLNIITLRNVKEAAETMNDEEFFNYLQYNYFDAINCDFDTPEKFLSFLEQIENIYIARLPGDDESIKSLNYKIGRGEVFQSILMQDSLRFAFNFYVSVEPDFYYSMLDGSEYIKSIENDSIKADIYKIKSREGFCADAVIYNQYANFRASEAQTLEDFETDFARLEFVKIGDLLNEADTNITE